MSIQDEVKYTEKKSHLLKIPNAKPRRLQRYGFGLIAAVLVIGLVMFMFNTFLRDGGRSASSRMQLAVIENGMAPSRDQMEQAVTILSARFSQLGIQGSNFRLKQTNGQSTILVTLPSLGNNDQQAVDSLIKPGKIGFWDTGHKLLAVGADFNPKDYAQYNPDGLPRFTNQDLDLNSLMVSQRMGSNDYAIGFRLQNEAIHRYAVFTSMHLGDAVTITLDDKVLMSAFIYASIPDGSAGIDGFTLQQAKAIVVALKTGVLPIELKKVS